MTEVYLKAREELIRILRARSNKDGLIKKVEAYEVIRGLQMGCLVGISDKHPHADIFVVGCCVFWEDAVRFHFIGKAMLPIEEVVDAINDVRVVP